MSHPIKCQNWQHTTTLFAQGIRQTPNHDAINIFEGTPEQIAQQLAIYQHNSQTYAMHALIATFPVIYNILKTQSFHNLATEYWQQHPSHSGDLQDYGQTFPLFCQMHALGKDHPYLSELGQLEWYVHRLYFAKDYQPISFEHWQAALKNPDHVKLHCTPNMHLINNTYEIDSLWHSYHINDVTLCPPLKKNTHLLVLRDANYDIHVLNLGAADLICLNALKTHTLLESLETALAHTPDWPITERLNTWHNLHLFISSTF